MTVFFHAIIRRQSIGHGPNRGGTIAEPVTRIRLQPGQDPEVLLSMNGWETCGRSSQRADMVVVPVQPTEWSKTAS